MSRTVATVGRLRDALGYLPAVIAVQNPDIDCIRMDVPTGARVDLFSEHSPPLFTREQRRAHECY